MECLVEFDYNATQIDELTIRKGDIIKNVLSFEEGWKKGWLNGKEGVFPENFVRVLKFESDSNENHTLLESDINSKNQLMMKVNNQYVNENLNKKQSSPLLGKKNFMISILPNMEKKKSTSSNVIADQISTGKSDLSKSEISKSFHNIDKTHSLESNKENKQVIVIFDYKAENPDELQLAEGELLRVLDKNLIDDGWWKGIKKTGEIGIFPSNFVKPYQENHSSTPLKKRLNDDCPKTNISENGSICDQSNMSDSTSFNNASFGGGTTLLLSPNKKKITTFAFKTKNVYGNSCSVDSLSEMTKSKKSNDIPIKLHNSIFNLRSLNQDSGTSKDIEIRNKIRSRAVSPANNDEDYYLLKSEFERYKLDIDHKMSKLSIRIQTLIEEIDEERKQRAASEIELVRLRRVVHMLDAQSSNGLF